MTIEETLSVITDSADLAERSLIDGEYTFVISNIKMIREAAAKYLRQSPEEKEKKIG